MERALLTDVEVRELLRRLYGLHVTQQKRLPSTDDVNIHVTTETKFQNEHISNISKDGYVLKILNATNSTEVTFIGAMHAAIERVSKAGITTSQPISNIRGQQHSSERLKSTSGQENIFLVRLFQYIAGEELEGKPFTPELCYEVGQLAANLVKALKGFEHPGLNKTLKQWNLGEMAKLSEKVDTIPNKEDRELVRDIVEHFEQNVVGNPKLLKGVIHGDLNEDNIIVKGSKSSAHDTSMEYHVNGVLDFGDMVYGFIVYEISTAVAYVMLESTTLDPIDAAGHTLAGYVKELVLPAEDYKVLKECICKRLAHSFTCGIYTNMLDPTNTYCLKTIQKGWPVLRKLWKTPKQELYTKWTNILNTYSLATNFDTS